ncbi:hypothetical protein VNI00_004019 [Paramarasmius palmivorus]|uniref:Uncharacterized protein n=1 Tax=Paramarasmius palmivorus TaxID=297713 RepID=A0AAW0DMZ3_9AGAR
MSKRTNTGSSDPRPLKKSSSTPALGSLKNVLDEVRELHVQAKANHDSHTANITMEKENIEGRKAALKTEYELLKVKQAIVQMENATARMNLETAKMMQGNKENGFFQTNQELGLMTPESQGLPSPTMDLPQVPQQHWGGGYQQSSDGSLSGWNQYQS